MKYSTPVSVIIFLAAALVCVRCSKSTGRGDNTAPVARAGNDTIIIQPVNNIYLRGSYSDAEFNVSRFAWRQVAGTPVRIETPTFYESKVQNMVPGLYSFELTVTDGPGLAGRDSIHIEVKPMMAGARVVDLTNVIWDCSWGCQIGVTNISAHVPPGIPFEVFLKNDQSPDWIHVLPDSLRRAGTAYSFTLDTGHLWIEWLGQGSPGANSCDLKLVY